MSDAAPSDAAAAYEARTTWQSGLFATLLVLASSLDRLVSERGVGRAETTVRLLSIAYLVGVVGVLWATRKRPSLHLALFAWTTAVIPYVIILPMMGHRWDAAHHPWEPLLRQAMAMMLLGAFAPARVLFGLLPIVLVLVESAIEYWLLGMRHSPALWFGTPGRVAFYAAIAVALAYRRGRALQRERALVEREQEAVALERLARVALAVYDVSNNAIQTLVASAALVEADAAQAAHVAPAMLRAAEKLKSVNDAFGSYQRQVEWRAGDESFDAAAVLSSGGGDRAAGATARRSRTGGE